MHILNTQEWRIIADAIEKKREKLLKQILVRNADNNIQKYSERDLLIAQIEMLDYFLQKPQDIAQYLKSTHYEENI